MLEQGGIPLQIREWFEYASSQHTPLDQVQQFMVSQLQRVIVLYQKVNEEIPFYSKGNSPNSKFVVAFTDPEAARQVKVDYPDYVKMVEESTLSFITNAIRSQVDGIVINPGLPSRYFILKQHLKEVAKEYYLHKLANITGPWVPTQGQHLLCVDAEQGRWAVAIYATEEDARSMCRQPHLSQAAVMQHSWSTIFEWCQRFRVHTPPYLNYGFPEAVLLTHQDIDRIIQGPKGGYQEITPTTLPFILPKSSPFSEQSREEEKPTVVAKPNVTEPPKNQATQEITQILRSSSQPQGTIHHTIGFRPDPFKPVLPKAMTHPEETNKELPQVAKPPVQKTSVDQKTSNPYSLKSMMRQPGTDIWLGPKQITIDISDWQVNDYSTEKDTVVPKANESAPFEQKRPALPMRSTSQPVEVENEDIDPKIRKGLQKLKNLTASGDVRNSWEVCETLAKLRKVWVITSQKEFVILAREASGNPVMDLFTSQELAQNLIDKEKEKKPNLPPLSPQLVEAEPLYKKFVKRSPAIWINRTSDFEFRISLSDPLPSVLQAMARKGDG